MRPEKEECECEECGQSFPDRRAYNAHRRQEHTEEKLFECDVCGQKSTKMSNLKVHMLLHTGEKRFKCEQCGRPFARAPDLRKHMRVHTGEKPFGCDECGRRFTQSNSLYGHKCANDATRKRAAAKQKLQRRPRQRSNTQNENIYGDSSSSEDERPEHRGRSPDERAKTIECEECDEEFVGRRAYNAHMRQVHEERKVYECDFCSYKCSRSSNLKQHMPVHTGEKHVKCNVCEKAFARKGDLSHHMRVHAEKPHECMQCGRRFAQSNALRVHKCRRKVDAGREKRHGCDVCSYKCYKSSTLKQHMLVHTGERRFKCSECGKAFARKDDLDKHMRVHTGEKPYGCDECGRRFAHSNIILYGHKCGSGVDVDRRSERGQKNAVDTSSSEDDFPEERQRAPSDHNSHKRRSTWDTKSRRDDTSRSVDWTPEKKQRQEARSSFLMAADGPKKVDSSMDLNSYLNAQLAKLENELRGGNGLDKRSDADVDYTSSSSTSSSEYQALSEVVNAMEHSTDDFGFDYESLML